MHKILDALVDPLIVRVGFPTVPRYYVMWASLDPGMEPGGGGKGNEMIMGLDLIRVCSQSRIYIYAYM